MRSSLAKSAGKRCKESAPAHDAHETRARGDALLPISRPPAVVDVAARGLSLFRDIRSIGNI